MKKAMRVLALFALVTAMLLVAAIAVAEGNSCENGHLGPYGYDGDDYEHWQVCEACGERTGAAYYHFRYCNESVCYTCGLAYEGSNYSHTGGTTYEYDDEQHWEVCNGCGEKEYWSYSHYRYCDADTCYTCEAPYTGDNVSHTGTTTTEHDDEQHWWVCDTCGEIKYEAEDHYRYCNGEICYRCEAPYTGDNVTHYSSHYEHNDEQHWGVCNTCGKNTFEPEDHYTYYCNGEYCSICSTPTSGNYRYHSGGYTYEYDDEQHWAVCDSCGDIRYEASSHYRYCDEDTCRTCDAPYTGDNLYHSGGTSYKYNDEQHWEVCNSCGVTRWGPSNHYKYCDSDTCNACDMPYDGDNVYHTGGSTYEYDDEQHWRVCNTCGETTYGPYKHYRYCNSDTCSTCDAPYTGDNFSHDGPFKYESNATQHWRICQACGETSGSPSRHYSYCTDPYTCYACEAEYAGNSVSHRYTHYEYMDGNQHAVVCDDCGETVNVSSHQADCTALGVCRYCEGEYNGTNLYHRSTHQAHDENYHWDECNNCGEMAYGPYDHYARCTDPTVCYSCGADYSGTRIDHYYVHYEQLNDTQHAEICDDCGEQVSASTHRARCNNLGVCVSCGADYTGSNVSHGSYYVEHDENRHWDVCNDCGEISWGPYTHHAACDNPGVCSYCDEVYTGSNISHSSGHYEYFDGTNHRRICNKCGEVTSVERHEASCANPGVCVMCDGAYTGPRVSHNTHQEHSATHHWWVCNDCGKQIDKETHYALCNRPGVCESCGEIYLGGDIYHWYTNIVYEGDVFYEVCEGCGEVLYGPYTHTHSARCTNPGICVDCGEPYTGGNVSHGSYYVQHDGDTHWDVCKDCGQISWGPYKHDNYVYCDAPTQCSYCDAVVVGVTPRHRAYYEFDGNNHWLVCRSCGEVVSELEAHYPGSVAGTCGACGELYLGFDVQEANLSGDFVVGEPIVAKMNAVGAYAYNYWLFDGTGAIVQEHTNTTDTSWTFTVETPGIYLLRTYATDFVSEGHADTIWFAVTGKQVSVSNVRVSGTKKVGQNLTGIASVKYGLAFNYWLFDSNGVIVQEHTNTTDTSWNFTIETPGVYLLRVYSTDFVTEAWADSEWFAVETDPVTVSKVTVTGDKTVGGSLTGKATVKNGLAFNYWLFNDQGTIVQEHTNTTDTSWSFSVSTPGTYLLRVYSTDFNTEAWADSEWFSIEGAKPENPVVISSVNVSTTNLTAGESVTVSASVSGGSGVYAFNYWVFDANGSIVMEKTNTLDTTATFTFNQPGAYLVRVYVTDFETETNMDSAWIGVGEAAVQAEVAPEPVEEEPAEELLTEEPVEEEPVEELPAEEPVEEEPVAEEPVEAEAVEEQPADEEPVLTDEAAE